MQRLIQAHFGAAHENKLRYYPPGAEQILRLSQKVSQECGIAEIEELGAQFIPKFLRRTLREKIFEVLPGHQRHGQHLVTRVFAKQAGNLDKREWRQSLSQELDIIGFPQVVRFSNNLLFNLVNRRFWYMTRRLCRLGEGAKQSKVVFDRPPDTRILNL